jgi:outer membrane protein insertion porin family
MQAAPRSGRQEDSRRRWAALERRLVATVLLLAGTAGAAGAQAQPGTLTLDSIGVTGNQRNTTPAIIAASGLVLNQPLNYRQVQRAIRALFQTGQFDDVAVEQLDVDGRTVLVFQVRERPLLERWVIRGAELIDPNTIRGRVNVPEGRPIDRAAIARSRHAIDSLYKRRGYYAAQVRVTETEGTTGQRVVFDIEEGNRVVISQVLIEGNERFPDAEVVAGMGSRPEGFWWYRRGEYAEDRVEEDIRERLPAWYGARGHIDFRVTGDSLIADTTPGKAILQLRVDEGRSYRAGTFAISGNRRFSLSELGAYFPFGGNPATSRGLSDTTAFDRSAWQAATGAVQELYANSGYIYASVEPEEVRRTGPDGEGYVDLRWTIREGQPAIINRIIILGNEITHERVIREAIVLLPGQVFSREAFIRSYRNIANLGFFQEPMPIPTLEPTANGVDVDLVFRVEERRTGNINFGASLGQGTGVGGFLGLEEPNLFGRAKRGRLQWQFGRNINDFNLSYSDPAIRESRVSGTLSLFNSRQRFTVGDLGRRRQQGGNLQLGFPLFGSRYTRLFAGYGYQRIRYTEGSEDLRQQFQCNNCVRSSLTGSVARDTRIGLPFPISGSSARVTVEVNGGFLGGTGNYQKLDLEGRWFTPLGRLGGTDDFGGGATVVLGFSAKSGFIVGDAGPFFTELYSLGGVQFGIPLRGYEEFSITPNGFDPAAGGTAASPNAFGKAFAAFTGELGIRVSQTLYANVFTDAGNVYRRARQFNPSRLFRSFGFGVALISPLGPLGIDMGYGLDKIDNFGQPAPGWQMHFRLGNFF